MIDVQKEIKEANNQLPVNIDQPLPVDIQLRVMAASIAARFIGDIAVKEGALYQQLKMDNKLGSPADINLLLNFSIILEKYFWGSYSQNIAAEAIEETITKVENVLKDEDKMNEIREKLAQQQEVKHPDIDDDPSRPTAG